MNIAPPPEMRRTTSKPYFSAFSGSTSFLTDWKLPMTTAGSSHSQMRSVGLAAALADLGREHLVQRQVHLRRAPPWRARSASRSRASWSPSRASGGWRPRRPPARSRAGWRPPGSASLMAAAMVCGVRLGGEAVDGRVDRPRARCRVRGRSRRRAGSPRSCRRRPRGRRRRACRRGPCTHHACLQPSAATARRRLTPAAGKRVVEPGGQVGR